MDRSLMLIYSRIFDDTAMGDMPQMFSDERTDSDLALETLAPDADPSTVAHALGELLNHAQREVLYRAHLIATDATGGHLATLENKP